MQQVRVEEEEDLLGDNEVHCSPCAVHFCLQGVPAGGVLLCMTSFWQTDWKLWFLTLSPSADLRKRVRI